MSWWSSRSSKGLYWSYTIGKSPYKGIIENQEIMVCLSEAHASGNREAFTYNDWWKANWWNMYQKERSRRTWNDEVWDLLKGSEPRRRIEDFFVKMVMDWWMLIFFSTEFSRQCFFRFRKHVVATTVCKTGVWIHYTNLLHAFFLRTARSLRISHTSHACHTRMAQVLVQRCLLHECFCPLSRFLHSHVPPVSAVPVHPLRHHPFCPQSCRIFPS